MFLDDVQIAGATILRLQLDHSNGLLAVASRRDDEAWTTHADMRLRLRAESTSPARIALAETRARYSEHVSGDELYASTGNDYRGEFRALKDGWGSTSSQLGLVEYESEESEHLHLRACAFLDACSHPVLWWGDHQRRPWFASAVDSYHINSTDRTANRVLWSAIETNDMRDDSEYRIFDASGHCLVHTTGWRTSSFAVGWLEETRARRHTYELQWKRCDKELPKILQKRKLTRG